MDVIIVSKTRMKNVACVSGILLANGRFVRLLKSNGDNQDANTDLEVGHVYTITFSERDNNTPPHIEDILVNSKKHKFSIPTIEMVEYLTDKLKVKIWEGSIESLFDGKLQWTDGGSGYISENGEIPDNSVGFWIPNKDLTRHYYKEKVKYNYPIKYRNISFVGFQKPIDKIPAGTLVRVSLARWWSPNEDEQRCYLQLSGWYGLPEQENETNDY